MSIDGASHACAILSLSSFPSRARRLHPSSYKFCISAFHQTLGPPSICMLSYDTPDLHASILHLTIYPGAQGTSLSNRAPLQNSFIGPISGKKRKPCAQKLTGGEFYKEEESLDLESKILEFMGNSERPRLFPSRSELLKAGRSDLVEAILVKGGWMVAGWDMESNTGEQDQKLADSSIANGTGEANAGVLCEPFRVQNKQSAFLGSTVDYVGVAEFATDSNISSCKGINGMLAARNQLSQSALAVSSLDRQKGWEKVADLFGLSSAVKPEHSEKPIVLASQQIPKKHAKVNGTSQLAAHLQCVDDFGSSKRDHASQLLAGGSQCSGVTQGAAGDKKRRRQKLARNRKALPPGDELVMSAKKKVSKRDCCSAKSQTPLMKSNEQQEDQKNISPLSDRIHGLEAELLSTLDILKSGRQALSNDITIKQRPSIASIELEEVSDALEFCETQIMNKKRELRTARAQRTALEGKLALELMDIRKDMEEKDKRLEDGMQVLKMLRTARIVWANPASEVFLAGSFDGWASWRKMEKSSAGVFVAALQLYPGQYEIKFIVNGEWRVDPNRPVTWANGYENNVLTIV